MKHLSPSFGMSTDPPPEAAKHKFYVCKCVWKGMVADGYVRVPDHEIVVTDCDPPTKPATSSSPAPEAPPAREGAPSTP